MTHLLTKSGTATRVAGHLNMSQLSIVSHIHLFATQRANWFKRHGQKLSLQLQQDLRESALQFLPAVALLLKMLTVIQSLHVLHLEQTILITVHASHLMKNAISSQHTLQVHLQHIAISIQQIMLHSLHSNQKKNHRSSSCV